VEGNCLTIRIIFPSPEGKGAYHQYRSVRQELLMVVAFVLQPVDVLFVSFLFCRVLLLEEEVDDHGVLLDSAFLEFDFLCQLSLEVSTGFQRQCRNCLFWIEKSESNKRVKPNSIFYKYTLEEKEREIH
jgi:hypothetical protein